MGSKQRILLTRSQSMIIPIDKPIKAERFGIDKVVVVTNVGKHFRIDENHPSFEGSHLLGDEGSFGAYHYYRDATKEEIEQYEIEQREKDNVAANKKMIATKKHHMIDLIKNKGEYPKVTIETGAFNLKGKRYFDTQDIYGGGDWFIEEDDYIWYCMNNGHDGDNWSLSNVLTGGAGAIGYRLKKTDEVCDQFRELIAYDK